MWTIFKLFSEFVTLLPLFYDLALNFFGHEACGITVTRPGTQPSPAALLGEVNHWTTSEVPTPTSQRNTV